MSRSRWFTWTPRMEKADEPKPTRTTNLDFVSFVSPQVDDFSIIDRSAIAKSSEPVLTKPPTPNPIIEKSPEMALTKLTKPNSVGFVGPRIGAFPIIETTKPTTNLGDSFRYKIAPAPPSPAAPGRCPDTSQSASRTRVQKNKFGPENIWRQRVASLGLMRGCSR